MFHQYHKFILVMHIIHRRIYHMNMSYDVPIVMFQAIWNYNILYSLHWFQSDELFIITSYFIDITKWSNQWINLWINWWINWWINFLRFHLLHITLCQLKLLSTKVWWLCEHCFTRLDFDWKSLCWVFPIARVPCF